MKTALALLCALTLCASAVAAGPQPLPPAANSPRAGIQLDVFGTAHSAVKHGGTAFGAGLGLNYYLSENLGVGLETVTENFEHSAVDQSNASLLLRYSSTARVNPYAFGGAGYQWEGRDFTLHAGGGLEFRLTRTFSLFTDARWISALEPFGHDNTYLGRLGARISF